MTGVHQPVTPVATSLHRLQHFPTFEPILRNRKQIDYALVCFLALSLPSRAQEDRRSAIAVHYGRAEQALSQGQSKIAAEEFTSILGLDPNNSQAYANLGVIAFKANDYAKAHSLFERALLHNPGLWDAKALLGLCKVRQGQTEPGVVLLEEAFPHVKNAEVKLDSGVAIITAHQAANTLRDALPIVLDLEVLMPNNPDVLYTSYRVFAELASEQVNKLAKVAPNSARVYQIYGEASMTQDDFARAVSQFRKAIELDPDLPGIHYQLGMALLTNSQEKTANGETQASFEAELKKNPSDARSEFELGEIARLNNQPDRAEQHYLRALTFQPALADAQVGLGTVLSQQGKSSESQQHFLAAIQLDPENELAHYRLSKAYRSAGRMDEANQELATFQQLHERNEARTPSSTASPARSSSTVPDR